MQTNAKQQVAVEAANEPVVIIAGPGTGKTRTLVARIEFLIARGVAPASILALTFTKKAAEEMSARIGTAAGSAAPQISTFHALCFDLLRQKLGKAPEFIAEPARLALIKKLPKPTQLKGVSVRELSLLISRAKNMADDNADIAQLVGVYNAELRAQNLHDFDDLLLQTRDLLKSDATWREHIQKRFMHILVDEFQDTNTLQYELLQLLRPNDNLFVIGDPLQSIYGFRGADGDIFARFLQDFPQAKTVVLDTNYRSAQRVVQLANAIYPDAPALAAHQTTPGYVQLTEVLSEYREAEWVLDQIQTSIGGSDLQRAVSDDDRASHRSLRDFAVLYRSRPAARILQKMLTSSGLPLQVVGEGSPYDQPGVQAVLQILGKVHDPERSAAIKDFSASQIAAIMATLDTIQTPYKLAEQIVEKFNLPVDADMRQLLGTLVTHRTIAGAVTYFDDIAAQDFYDPRADAITLLTIHAAKGLEFTHVFLIAAEEGVLPSKRGNEAEEKRLFYVAATRAKERLDVLFTRFRGGGPARLSRFVAAIDSHVFPKTTDQSMQKDQRRAQKRQAKRAQATLF